MASTIKVSMADLKVAKAPDSLTTLGLGSCIGLTLYDRSGFKNRWACTLYAA